MCRKVVLLAFLLSASFSGARDKVENWVEVRSPHFVVATDSNEKQARRVADQFERMRSVFHVLFPKLNIDPSSPIIVLAVKNEKDFRALEPEVYLAKGQLKLGGLFLRAADKNYVLMRLDAEGEHPYSVIYHEYTHLLMSKADWMPLWMNEGLAEFYQNTDINEKEASFGQFSPGDIELLRQNRLLPLATLFAVDHNSPYYHEEHKGSIFYAESWALMHYLEVKDYQQKTHRLSDYADLLAKKTDPVSAADAAFGDLKQLEIALFRYVQDGRYNYFRLKTTTEVDDSAFKAALLSSPETDALRADFLAYNQRTQDARTLLAQVLQEDPKNVSAHETMGFLEFQQRHLDEAKKWYTQAVQLDSQSYLAHYYYAAISIQESPNGADDAQVEASLRKAIQLNPSFAPAFDSLAVFLGRRHRNLEEAHMMALTAVGLEPTNVAFRVNVANVLMQMEQGDNAVHVLQNAAKLAKTPQESQWVESVLMNAQEFVESQKQMAEQRKRMNEDSESATGDAIPEKDSAVGPHPRLVHREFVAAGPHHFLTGVLKDVHCESSNMDLAVKSSSKTITLHSENYYRIQFSALGFTPSADLKPCSDLEGRSAKVEYVESANKTDAARPISIELHK